MSQYNIAQAFILSFFSRKLYRDVAVNWGGKTFLYLFILLACSWVLFTYQVQSILNIEYDKYADNIVSQLPILTVTNGRISTPENRPYFVSDPQSHKTIAVIDTSGKYTRLDQVDTAVLVTETDIISQPKPTETRIDKLPEKLTAVINFQIINGYIKNFLSYAFVLIFLCSWLVSYLYRILQTLFYGLLGKIFSAIFNVTLSYSQVVQIAMIAITPSIVLATVIDSFAIAFPHRALFYLVLSLFYLFYGILANK